MAPDDDAPLAQVICRATGARAVRAGDRVARLWSGYGEIRRYALEGASEASVIVKRVTPPGHPQHRRGWATARSHARKLHSYAVERSFYEHFAPRCGPDCRVPRAYHLEQQRDGWLFVLEDLDAAGYAGRRARPTDAELGACLDWLASFHARFLSEEPAGLWPEGTYWHLATRPDELAAMPEGALRDAAARLDRRLRRARWRTLVHGDAKVENFCFAPHSQVAAVDFQYAGGGVGVKDVAYFLSSCLTSDECAAREEALVERYFDALRAAVARLQPDLDSAPLEAEWRGLYACAWADFTRFLSGWAPGHAKLHNYALNLTRGALAELDDD